MDRAEQWLHGRRRALEPWASDAPAWGTQELLAKALAGVDALEAARALAPDEAAAWRVELRDAAAGVVDERPGADVPADTRRAADRLLQQLLEQTVAEDHGRPGAGERFDGALDLLGGAGIVDPAEWEEREGELLEWPSEEQARELNAGGTQVELRRVYAGPEEERGGRRLVYVLVFADGVSCLVEHKGPDTDLWHLSDDAGAEYMPGGGRGRESEELIDFLQAPPPGARWLELALHDDPGVSFRVAL